MKGRFELTYLQLLRSCATSPGYMNTHIERNNSYYFSLANQQKAGTKIYSLTQCSLTVNEYDWHILAGNDVRINSHCLTRWVEIPPVFERQGIWKHYTWTKFEFMNQIYFIKLTKFAEFHKRKNSSWYSSKYCSVFEKSHWRIRGEGHDRHPPTVQILLQYFHAVFSKNLAKKNAFQ